MRNRVFDIIATLLFQQAFVESCLEWISSLIQNNIAIELVRHTQRSLIEGLVSISMEASKQGVFATRLEADMRNAVKLY